MASFLMCAPEHFDVTYRINPWMDPTVPVDRAAAMREWHAMVDVYEELGHDVRFIEPGPGLPDMVFAANSGTVIDGVVLPARFRHEERRGEEHLYRRWFRDNGYVAPEHDVPINEGEGDVLVVGDLLLCGSGYRSDPGAALAAQECFGLPAVVLTLVDPRYYHLDIALGVLDASTIAYLPAAFSEGSRRALERCFPDAIIALPEEAAKFALNFVSDGEHVVLPAGAPHLEAEIAARGFTTHVVQTDELRKAGGSVKCCTLELRS
jgi:N-dimethylarginine dimethylaminohydrolase